MYISNDRRFFFAALVSAIFLCLISTKPIFCQIANEKPEIERANEVLESARAKIFGANPGLELKTLKYVISGTTNSSIKVSLNEGRPRESTRSFNTKETKHINFSGKARSDSVADFNSPISGSDTKMTSSTVVNGIESSTEMEILVNGKRVEMDKTKATKQTKDLMENWLSKLGLDKSKFDFESGLGTTVAKATYETFVQSLFPFLFQIPEENKQLYRYVGKAESNGITADVIELMVKKTETGNDGGKDKPKLSSTVRYFFDHSSHLLIMKTVEFDSEIASMNSSEFYSEHKLMDGVLIPTKIKYESESKMKTVIEVMGMKLTGNTVSTIVESAIEEFVVNPKIPESVFEIKKKAQN